jgi:hypothetical protein
MSIADCGITLMLGYKVNICMEPTHEYDKSFVFVSYLDIFQIYSDFCITHSYDYESRVVLSCECTAIPRLNYYEAQRLIAVCHFGVARDHHEPLSESSRFTDVSSIRECDAK